MEADNFMDLRRLSVLYHATDLLGGLALRISFQETLVRFDRTSIFDSLEKPGIGLFGELAVTIPTQKLFVGLTSVHSLRFLIVQYLQPLSSLFREYSVREIPQEGLVSFYGILRLGISPAVLLYAVARNGESYYQDNH